MKFTFRHLFTCKYQMIYGCIHNFHARNIKSALAVLKGHAYDIRHVLLQFGSIVFISPENKQSFGRKLGRCAQFFDIRMLRVKGEPKKSSSYFYKFHRFHRKIYFFTNLQYNQGWAKISPKIGRSEKMVSLNDIWPQKVRPMDIKKSFFFSGIC